MRPNNNSEKRHNSLYLTLLVQISVHCCSLGKHARLLYAVVVILGSHLNYRSLDRTAGGVYTGFPKERSGSTSIFPARCPRPRPGWICHSSPESRSPFTSGASYADGCTRVPKVFGKIISAISCVSCSKRLSRAVSAGGRLAMKYVTAVVQ